MERTILKLENQYFSRYLNVQRIKFNEVVGNQMGLKFGG